MDRLYLASFWWVRTGFSTRHADWSNQKEPNQKLYRLSVLDGFKSRLSGKLSGKRKYTWTTNSEKHCYCFLWQIVQHIKRILAFFIDKTIGSNAKNRVQFVSWTVEEHTQAFSSTNVERCFLFFLQLSLHYLQVPKAQRREPRVITDCPCPKTLNHPRYSILPLGVFLLSPFLAI